MTTFSQWAERIIQRTETALDRTLPPSSVLPQRLHQAMRYAVLGGGKRIRALLVHAAGHINDAPALALDSATCALEMIHAYSLVHDDLPCMDNDDLRRGKATVHKAYDEATALLVGDALQAQAFICLSTAPLEINQRLTLIHELAQASSTSGMVGGQAIDLASVGIALNQRELETMHQMKTGALLRAAVRMGLACGHHKHSPVPMNSLDDYAQTIGLAFQVVDDILDASAETATLGKTAGKDAIQDKPTYVSLLGLDAARALASTLHERAQTLLDNLLGQQEHTHMLRELTRFIVLRTH